MNAFSMQEAAERIISHRLQRAKTSQEITNLKQVLKNVKASNYMQKIENDMAKKHIFKTDPLWEGIISPILNDIFTSWERSKRFDFTAFILTFVNIDIHAKNRKWYG